MRTATMTRFPEPDEDRAISKCEECQVGLYKFQEVFEYEDYHFCDNNCLHDYLLKEGVIKCIDLQEK